MCPVDSSKREQLVPVNYMSICCFNNSDDNKAIHSVMEGIKQAYMEPTLAEEKTVIENNSVHFGYSIIIYVQVNLHTDYYLSNRSSGRAFISSAGSRKKICGDVRMERSVKLDASTIYDSNSSDQIRYLKGVIIHLTLNTEQTAVTEDGISVIPHSKMEGHYITYIRAKQPQSYYRVNDLYKSVVVSTNQSKYFHDYINHEMGLWKAAGNYPVIEVLWYVHRDGLSIGSSPLQKGVFDRMFCNAIGKIESLHSQMVIAQDVYYIRMMTGSEIEKKHKFEGTLNDNSINQLDPMHATVL